MTVRLEWITTDAERTMIRIARVSNPANQDNPSYEGLLRHCLASGHWSVFEQAYACLDIHTSRAIAAQILRHRSATFQEFSQRYSAPEAPIVYQARRQASKNRQSSTDDLAQADREWFASAQDEVNALASRLYTEARERGIARECARFLLPLSTGTRIYMTASIRTWITYLRQRLAPDTQFEHREVAASAARILAEHLPVIARLEGWLVDPGPREDGA